MVTPVQYVWKPQYSMYKTPEQYVRKPQYSMSGNPTTVCMETPVQYVWKPLTSDTVHWNHIFQNAGQWDKTVKDSERSNSMLFHSLTEWLSPVADTVFVINIPSHSLYLNSHICTRTYEEQFFLKMDI